MRKFFLRIRLVLAGLLWTIADVFSEIGDALEPERYE